MSDTNGVTPRRQFLFMTVSEAWGLSKEQEPVWDESFKEGYVRVEIRGGPKSQKATTFTQAVENYSMSWNQEIRLELNDTSKELRIMLCKERAQMQQQPAPKKTAAVVAACGIFIKDILEAVPIDKHFELFKPGEKDSTLGGYIRVILRTGARDPGVPSIEEAPSVGAEEPPPQLDEDPVIEEQVSNRGGHLFRILLLAGLAATITFFRIRSRKKPNSS